jgi:hypothetical protein
MSEERCPYEHRCDLHENMKCPGSYDISRNCVRLDDPDFWF